MTVDDRGATLGHTGRGLLQLLPLTFLNFSVGAGAFCIIGLIGPLSTELSLTKVQAGWIMSVLWLGLRAHLARARFLVRTAAAA